MSVCWATAASIGVHLSYKVQPSPDGLAQAFLLGEEFIGDDCCAMVLGDNIFYGNGFAHLLRSAVEDAENGQATIFGYYVNDPERFGIVEFDENGQGYLRRGEARRIPRAITASQVCISMTTGWWSMPSR